MAAWRDLLALSVICLAGLASGEVECQPDLEGYTFVNTATEVCYQLVYEESSRKTWSDARQYCQDRSGRLVNIDSPEKQTQIESFMKLSKNMYKPENYDAPKYNALDKNTWGNYDPDVWIGATRDSDGVTWRFDTYTMSRTSRSSIVLWFNYGADPVEQQLMEDEKKKYLSDVCMYMRYNYVNETVNSVSFMTVKYPWYMHLYCNSGGLKSDGSESAHPSTHPFLCEYFTYDYIESRPRNWVYVIALLGAFLACGFFACAMYCLWDKMHTSYNVLQI